MSQLLNERWSETKEALLEGLQGNKRSTMAVCLENTRRQLAESATAGATSTGNIATLNRVILPVIRREHGESNAATRHASIVGGRHGGGAHVGHVLTGV